MAASFVKQGIERSGLLGLGLRARRSAPLILMYHGVSGDEHFAGLRNASGLHMRRSVFVEHLELLRQYRRVIGIGEMVDGLRNGDDMRNTVALTFDDGYLNNYEQVAPALADFKMPGSFYLTTAYIGTRRWMWTDLVEHALDRTTRAALPWPGHADGMPLGTLDARRAALRAVKAHMKTLSVAERDRQVADLLDQLGVDPGEPMLDYRFMDWTQARKLSDSGFEVGAHTVNHAILSRLPAAEAAAEIVDSREAVVEGTGQCCDVFCYPNGKPGDYTPEVMQTCRQHFKGAIATHRGPAKASELYQLARLGMDGGPSQLAWALFQEA